MYNNMPFGGPTINLNFGGYPPSPPLAGVGMNGDSQMMMQMMQMIQMFMTLTAQMLSLTMAQQGGGIAPPGLSNFGGGLGMPGSPGLGGFLGQGQGGGQGTGGSRGAGGGHGSNGSKEAGHGHDKVGEKTGNLVDIGGGKKVDSSIAGNVKQMIADAKKDGIDLQITSANRTRQEQEVLYAKYKNGTGNLAAKPGTSNHESGLAIDFTNTPGAHAWLAKNAGRYGLKNLPGEPWHYSPSGR